MSVYWSILIARCIVRLFDGIWVLCNAYLLPIHVILMGRQCVSGKRPKSVAVVLSDTRQVKKWVTVLKESSIEKTTFYIDGPVHECLSYKNVEFCQVGSFPSAYLDNLVNSRDIQSEPFDLLIDTRSKRSLCGLDGRRLGFTELKHLPVACSFFVRPQAKRALAAYASCRQNFGK